MIESYKEYGDLSIKDFFRKQFMDDFQGTCKALSEFYLLFSTDTHIYDFHGNSFYLDI